MLVVAGEVFDGGSFVIEWRWKEEVVYWEGEHGFRLDAGWGVDPPWLYVPSPRIWDMVVPEWLAGRRAEVVDRLAAHNGHRVMDDDAGYDWMDAETQGRWTGRAVTR
jgi:hypothetical protein